MFLSIINVHGVIKICRCALYIVLSTVKKVQLEDLEKARKNILKSNITLSSIGPIKDLESLESVKRRFS